MRLGKLSKNQDQLERLSSHIDFEFFRKNLVASKQDIKITKQIKAALELIDVLLLDHLIITDDCYLSMQAHGLV